MQGRHGGWWLRLKLTMALQLQHQTPILPFHLAWGSRVVGNESQISFMVLSHTVRFFARPFRLHDQATLCPSPMVSLFVHQPHRLKPCTTSNSAPAHAIQHRTVFPFQHRNTTLLANPYSQRSATQILRYTCYSACFPSRLNSHEPVTSITYTRSPEAGTGFHLYPPVASSLSRLDFITCSPAAHATTSSNKPLSTSLAAPSSRSPRSLRPAIDLRSSSPPAH